MNPQPRLPVKLEELLLYECRITTEEIIRKRYQQSLDKYLHAEKLYPDTKEYDSYKEPLYSDITGRYYIDWGEVLEAQIISKEEGKGFSPIIWCFAAVPDYLKLPDISTVIIQEAEDKEYPNKIIELIHEECKSQITAINKLLSSLENKIQKEQMYSYKPNYSLVVLPPKDYLKEVNALV